MAEVLSENGNIITPFLAALLSYSAKFKAKLISRADTAAPVTQTLSLLAVNLPNEKFL